MRWDATFRSLPARGTIRYVRRFLLFPTCIGKEYRWLEWVWIKQSYGYLRDGSDGEFGWNEEAWEESSPPQKN